MAEIKFEIIEKIGVLSESTSGWSKQLNRVSWNDRPAKYDLRDWSPDDQMPGKGLTLTLEELKNLRDLLNKILTED